MHIPLSQDGQVMAYVWPVRALNVRGSWCGGPTIGIDVGNEEVIRFDCHDKPGHWHGGGYDKSGMPGNSHRDFPKGIEAVADQVDWSLQQVSERTADLLAEAEYTEAAESVDSLQCCSRPSARSEATWSSRATCATRPSARGTSTRRVEPPMVSHGAPIMPVHHIGAPYVRPRVAAIEALGANGNLLH